MLSIGKIASGQHRYYERQVARGEDDYYAGRGETPGVWSGAGARALGLRGRVTAEQLTALIESRDPRGSAGLLRDSPRPPKVAAFDLTFSAPKSVSILFAVAPEETSGVLVACHEEAVRAALGYLEETAVRVRRGHAGEHVERARGLIAASYRHRMSRALDPQLHTHVVAANLAQGLDGRFTALHSSELYRAARTAGFLYQAQLRALVSERLGLEWREVLNGAAELVDVPRQAIEFFSKRREQMLREARREGVSLERRAGAELVALRTRERKQYGIQTPPWREEVRADAAAKGLTAWEVRRLLAVGAERVRTGRLPRTVVDEAALGDRLAGPAGLTERANSFDERAVLREFAAAATQGSSPQEVRAQAGRFIARRDVLETARGEMSTEELVGVERRLIAAVVGRAQEECGVVDPAVAARVMRASERRLSALQASAVRAVLHSGHGVSVIEALAGTGKTYTAGMLREVYEATGKTVLGVAPTGRAARELAQEAGCRARTIDGLLGDLERGEQGLPQGCVVILDEAGMAPTRISAGLLQAAHAAGAKVVAIGDPGQLPSVQAGGWMRAVGRELGTVRLTDVMRQRDPQERRVLAALHEREPRPFLRWAGRHRIHTFEDQASAARHALERWPVHVMGEPGPAPVVMIARENDLRDTLNHAAREKLKERGMLGEERDYATLALAVGDRVICRRNDRPLDVDNGMRGTVRETHEDHVVIATDGGPTRELPAAYVAEHVEHAYALTGHGMQGATVDEAIVLASPHELSAGWSYTALSRARGETQLLVYEERLEHDREEYAPYGESETPTRAQLLARVEKRMSERDDEDLAIEQLPARSTDEHTSTGRATDPALTSSRALAHEPHQEHAASRAQPNPPQPPPTPERLRETHEHIKQLEAQLQALPTKTLRYIEQLDKETLGLSDRNEAIDRTLATQPPTSRPYDVEQISLGSLRHTFSDQLVSTGRLREKLTREAGDPAEARTEQETLKTALHHATQEHTTLREELIKQELQNPSPWITQALGERPQKPRQQQAWEKAIRHATTYRATHNITDPNDPLGPRPQDREQRRDWQRAQITIEDAQQRLQRTPTQDLGIGP